MEVGEEVCGKRADKEVVVVGGVGGGGGGAGVAGGRQVSASAPV